MRRLRNNGERESVGKQCGWRTMSRERYDDLATGQNAKEQRQRQNKRLIEGAKEVGGRNSSRTKGSDESRHVGGNRQTSTILHKAMLDVAILKRPRGLVLVVFWRQRPTTSSS